MFGRFPSRHRAGRSARHQARRQGFTLMELLLVLAILVILGSLAGISITTMRRNSNIRAAKVQIDMFTSAIKVYEMDVGALPPSLDALVNQPEGLRNPDKWAGPYLEKAIPNDPWQNEFQFTNNGDSYSIVSFGPNGSEGGGDDITNN
jgi:general secretion pathway protein G